MRMRTTVAIEDRLLRRAKKAAAQRGMSLAGLIEVALMSMLNAPAKPPVRLPVSSATGGFQAGIDPTRNETLWAALDDE